MYSSKRFLHQIGDEEDPVSFVPIVQHVAIQKDTQRIVLTSLNCNGERAAFDAAIMDTKEAARRWLKARSSTEVFDFCGIPTCKKNGEDMSVQMIVRIACRDVQKVLRTSGQDAVFARLFFEGAEDAEKFRVVPFAARVDLAAAIRQASRMSDHFGIVKTHKGFGARVLAANFEDAVRFIRTEDAAAYLGTRYEISGLPLSCGRDAIEDLLKTWTGAVPITTYRSYRTRTWLVSAPSAPLHDKIQHEEGLAYIQTAQPRSQHKKAQGIRFVPSEKPKEEPSWLRSWAGKPRSKPAAEPSPSSSPPPPPQMPAAPCPPAEVLRLSVPSSSSQDLGSMIQEAIAKAMAPFAGAMRSMECKVASLASEMVEVQKQQTVRDGRTTSRSRGRVPVGKKLYA